MKPTLPALLCLSVAGLHAPAHAQSLPSTPAKGERIVLVGGGLAERMFSFDHFEAELQLRFPDQEVIVRNMARQGDTAGFRPHSSRKSQWAFPGAEKFNPDLQQHNGKGHFPMPDEWLKDLKADTIVGFFGYSESFNGEAGLANFEAELDAFARHTLAQKYNGASAPRLVFVSPIAFENLTPKKDLPDGKKENANLALYTAAMKRVAEKNKVGFIDVFAPTGRLYASEDKDLTINGFALNDLGYRKLAPLLADGLFASRSRASKADPGLVLEMVKEKNWCWFNDYNILNGVHTHGQRYEPYGPQNYPAEIEKTREMTVIREKRLHEIAQGKATSLAVDDSKTKQLPEVKSNFNKPIEYLPTDKALEKFTLQPGFKIELFASEEKFPNLQSPMQMSFDARGRLWVAVTPTYPHWRPGDARPNDKILIYEDTNGDGKADKETVFADHLQLPIGFELAPEGVYLSQEPNLALLVDDNKDDKADRMEIILGGFDTHDTHHAISAYGADAAGAFYLCEGRFLHSQVETAYGPQRCNDGGVWRFDPVKQKLERFMQTDVNNPWGVAFNEWDQMFLSDASGGNNWWGLPLSAKMPYGVEIPKVAEFAPKRARPTSGSDFISSRHFPDEYQGRFILNNCIGFLGTSMWDIKRDGAGYDGKHVGDLVSSSDPNFRPVDCEFAPDGSLYIVDWHNALIGHMQHNARDPNRNKSHGRVYRVTYPARPLVKPYQVADASIPKLLEGFKEPEYRTRYRIRRELRGRPASEVLPAVKRWVSGLDKNAANYDLLLCEALWVTWGLNKVDTDILNLCLASKASEARAAAVHVLRYAHRDIPNSMSLLWKAASEDAHPQPRLEAIVAASWLDNEAGARIALAGLNKPLDRWMVPVTKLLLEKTLADDVARLKASGKTDDLAGNKGATDHLAGKFKFEATAPADDESKAYGPTRPLSDAEKKVYALGKEVFHRDAHCATCHQSNGKGLQNIYPPLEKSEWVNGDETRLIKIVLKGLYGVIEVNGQKFDPAKGVPPMMGFAGLLKDNEAAAVINYVRSSFGNNAPWITPEKVRSVREATKDRANFYTVEELLKEHPFKK